jgi:hypothetical protein
VLCEGLIKGLVAAFFASTTGAQFHAAVLATVPRARPPLNSSCHFKNARTTGRIRSGTNNNNIISNSNYKNNIISNNSITTYIKS